MRMVVSGGGTGGHVYPGLTVARSLLGRGRAPGKLPALELADILWIGTRGGMEEGLVQQAGLAFVALAAGGLRGMALWIGLRNACQIAGSVVAARRILAEFRPHVVLSTGGYACVAVTLAAWSMRIPVMIYLPDIVPGLAIRFLSRFADRIALTSEDSYRYFPRDKTVVTGYPVRPEFSIVARSEAQAALHLEPGVPTLLAFGGSRGARSINRALVGGLRELLPVCQVVHVTGRLDADWVAAATSGLPQDLLDRYHRHAYLDDLPSAMLAADLAVARAGAAVMGELPAAGLAAILVPYPYSGQHQQPNADYLARGGAALVLADAVVAQELVPAVLRLLKDDQAMATMRESSRAMARPDAAELIAEQLWSLARQHAVPRTG